MVIYCPPQLPGNGNFITVEAETTLGKTIRYENDFLVLQSAKKGLFSKPSGKNYRIIAVKTEMFLEQKSPFHGKKIMIAESDEWSEILSDWSKIESYLLPMVTVISKKEKGMTQAEFEDVLSSLTQKKASKAGLRPIGSKPAKTKKTLTINGVTVNENTLKSDHDFVDLGASDSPTIDEEDEDKEELTSVETYEQAVIAIEEFIKKTALTQRLLDNYGKKPSSQQRIANDIIEQTKRLKAIQKMLDDFFKTASKNSIIEKIIRQYSEEKPKFTKILNNPSHKKITNENTKDIYDKKKPSASKDNMYNNSGEIEVGDGSQQQVQIQQQKDQFVLSQWDKATIDVEHAIAKETHEDLKRLETDFTELHGMYQDFHSLAVEQQESLDTMIENVQAANAHIDTGVENVKKAKKLTRFGFF
ncbi:hypothetical protein C9374_014592 [Naegleria lovaniensis]|uniref:t-SNARE coiled-coil homology domain-containing protein n=1 Tax=Naegleria lovaniensis TaxID=51637 RepID=A0AA88GY36_NAELO|nr:uncharacterized protein C9374_014592 [Naegleria lovaniensis]KAG2389192.1 hypothetical protein C9374_014592 [Naegleria lovaniensis]